MSNAIGYIATATVILGLFLGPMYFMQKAKETPEIISVRACIEYRVKQKEWVLENMPSEETRLYVLQLFEVPCPGEDI